MIQFRLVKERIRSDFTVFVDGLPRNSRHIRHRGHIEISFEFNYVSTCPPE
jgi:hypothetical protein